jgi:tetratricopeptide (TPR) repeat protein
MLRTDVTKNVIAPRRQARKERPILISPNLGAPFDSAQDMLCAFARVTVFPMSLIRNSNRNFKCLWLVFVLIGCAAYQAAGQVQSGRQALLINKPEDALAYFQQVAQTNPNYVFQSVSYREGIWTYVGRSQYSLGRLPEARQSLEKALSIYPDDNLRRSTWV